MTTLTAEQLAKILDEKLEEKCEQKFIQLNDTISELKTKVEEAMEHVKFVNAKYDELIQKVETLEAEKKLIANDNKIVKKSIRTVEGSLDSLAQVHNDLEQYGRHECIEIKGIPAPTQDDHENTNNIVVKVGALIGVEVSNEDISVCHRLPHNKDHG